jgi:hypothetical protein
VSNETHKIEIGRTGKVVTLCAAGKAKIFGKKLGLKSGASPYVYVRWLSALTDEQTRQELGRFLLEIQWPVLHLDGDDMNFALSNLKVAPSEPDIEPEPAPKARKKSKSARQEFNSDGLTPDQQVEKLGEIFPTLLRNASFILRDCKRNGSASSPTEEQRGPEIVQDIVTRLIERIRSGERISNVEAFAKYQLNKHAVAGAQAKAEKSSPIMPSAGERALTRSMKERLPSNRAYYAASGADGMFVGYNPATPKHESLDTIEARQK